MSILFLHIGMQKTGTTSIQNILYANRTSLLASGIYYPGSEINNHSLNFMPMFKSTPSTTSAFRGVPVDAIPESLEQFERFWISEFKKTKYQKFIISAEALNNLTRKEVPRVKDFVAPYFDEIKVVAYVRHPVEFIPSLIQQLVKSGEYFDDIYDFVKRQCKRAAIPALSAWVHSFGAQNIIIRPFDRAEFREGELVKDFLSLITEEDIELNATDQVWNYSIGGNDVLLLAELNRRYPMILDGKFNKRRGLSKRQDVILNILSRVKQDKFTMEIFFDEELAKTINQNLEEINELLSGSYRFDLIEASAERFSFKMSGDLSPEYFIEVINEYNKYIDELLENPIRKVLSKGQR